MDAASALVTIRQYAVAGRLAYTHHALERMAQRNVTRADVRRALTSAKSCRAGDAADKWVALGPDTDGDDLDVVVVIEAGLVIVTVH
jgi:hypothetical protein